jgi:excisionase family DNA binding protein
MPKSHESNRIERVFLTFREAQDFFGVSHQTLYKLMGEGLPSHKIGKKRVFFKEDLITWIKEH